MFRVDVPADYVGLVDRVPALVEAGMLETIGALGLKGYQEYGRGVVMYLPTYGLEAAGRCANADDGERCAGPRTHSIDVFGMWFLLRRLRVHVRGPLDDRVIATYRTPNERRAGSTARIVPT